jgi:hypothetical protein
MVGCRTIAGENITQKYKLIIFFSVSAKEQHQRSSKLLLVIFLAPCAPFSRVLLCSFPPTFDLVVSRSTEGEKAQ